MRGGYGGLSILYYLCIVAPFPGSQHRYHLALTVKYLPNISGLLRLLSKSQDLRVSGMFAGVAVILGLTCIWAYRQYITSPPYVDPERYPVRGIDVSSHNGMMNLDAARSAGIEFIFIKASEGVDFHDPNFKINYTKASHAGMHIGAYHFFRFDREGIPQAKNLLDAVGGRPLALGLAIDIERAGNPEGIDSVTISHRLIDMVEYLHLRGYRVTCYSNREGYYDYIRPSLPGIPLWICSFSRIPFDGEWTFWQYDHHGKVPGILHDVDLNTFCGSRREWSNYLAGSQWPYDTPPSYPDPEPFEPDAVSDSILYSDT